MHNTAPLGPQPARTDRLPEAALRVLRALAAKAQPITSAELTAELGGHPNTVRPHLERLVAGGFIEPGLLPAHGRGRPARGYRATIAGRQLAGQDAAALAGSALLGAVSEELRAGPEPSVAARRVGRSWGRRLGAGQGVVSALSRQGFTPEEQPDGLHLLSCPLLEEARAAPEVVCNLHQGMLDALSPEPLVLVPFAGPGYCLVRPAGGTGASAG